MLRLPKFNGFRKIKDLDIIQRMRMRRYFSYLGVLILLVFFGIAIATNMFNGGQKTKAAVDWVCDEASCTISYRPGGLLSPNFLIVAADDTRFDNRDVTITGPLIVYFAGHHNFKSLTISNSAKVTHQMLGTADFDSSTFALTTSGQEKIVDFTIAGDLVLDSGGTIDVSGKGYPGGLEADASDAAEILSMTGKGPGGGAPAIDCCNFHAHAPGASHGGAGGVGRDRSGWLNASPSYDANTIQPNIDFASTNLLPGSGAGAATHNGGRTSAGGRGGGRIKILSGKIRILDNSSGFFANGTGPTFNDDGDVCGGSGSGGSIVIQTGQVSPELSINVLGGHNDTLNGDFAGSGSKGLAYVNGHPLVQDEHLNSVNDNKYFQARGGDIALGRIAGTGGGGIVAISIVSEVLPKVTMQKILTPLNRPGLPTGSEANFNPYALRNGDKIRVTINAESLKTGDTIKDYFLRQPTGSYYCKPNDGSLVPDGTTNADNITWTATNDNQSQTFIYDCTVTK